MLCAQPTSEQENSKNNVERRKRASNDALFATGSSNLIQDFPKAFV
ncbi:putative hypothetcical protein [Vibrio parahaemolyticus V-223/04]|nr:putative hypothetcical protein [Vibrio parahaemolyticus V-223/04]EWM34756.1 putative hypothetcical protein [Vibrio parahaemolyticus EKP-021]